LVGLLPGVGVDGNNDGGEAGEERLERFIIDGQEYGRTYEPEEEELAKYINRKLGALLEPDFLDLGPLVELSHGDKPVSRAG
jgi:hypothetical protein